MYVRSCFSECSRTTEDKGFELVPLKFRLNLPFLNGSSIHEDGEDFIS